MNLLSLFLHRHSFLSSSILLHLALLSLCLLWSYFYLLLSSWLPVKMSSYVLQKGVDAISSLFPRWISGKNSKFKCRHMKQDKILLIPSDVLLKILLLQVELHMNETTKEVNTTGSGSVSMTSKLLRGYQGQQFTLFTQPHTHTHLIKHCTDGNRNKLSF